MRERIIPTTLILLGGSAVTTVAWLANGAWYGIVCVIVLLGMAALSLIAGSNPLLTKRPDFQSFRDLIRRSPK